MNHLPQDRHRGPRDAHGAHAQIRAAAAGAGELRAGAADGGQDPRWRCLQLKRYAEIMTIHETCALSKRKMWRLDEFGQSNCDCGDSQFHSSQIQGFSPSKPRTKGCSKVNGERQKSSWISPETARKCHL